jgi:hypothetical protein
MYVDIFPPGGGAGSGDEAIDFCVKGNFLYMRDQGAQSDVTIFQRQ